MESKHANLITLKPLEITCKSTDCNNNLHCFSLTKKMKETIDDGCCRKCGLQLVDRNRTRLRKIDDVNYTFEALRYELWRHYYWHIDFDIAALNHAKRKGLLGMKEASKRRIRTAVGKPASNWDGLQTPKNGNILFYAQHATATCCRKCIEEWHGIQQNINLSEKEIVYFSDLLMLYVKERLPGLSDKGEYVPRQGSNRKDQ